MNTQLRNMTALALAAMMLFSMLPLNVLAALITTDYSGGFSIRSVIPVVDTYTYKFYVGTNPTPVATQIVKDGQTLLEPSVPADPSGANFPFMGWYDAPTGGNKIAFGPVAVTSTQTISVYARFAATYKVSFVYVNTLGNTIQLGTKTAYSGDAVNADGISYADSLEPRKVFSHWSATNGGAAYNFSTPVTGNMTLYLITNNLWRVTFDAKGGTPVRPIYVENGQNLSAANPSSTKAGYDFKGWQLSGTTATYNLSTPITADIVLEAKWSRATIRPTGLSAGTKAPGGYQYSYAGSIWQPVPRAYKPTGNPYYGVYKLYIYAGETKSIDGEGNTLVNVYYKRKVLRSLL